MENLEQIYDRAFFSEWGSKNQQYVATAQYITGILHRELRPRRLIDIGCGCGVYSHFFRELGVEVVALDCVVAPAEYAYEGPVELCDLTKSFTNTWGEFDLGLCLEVAEHIPAEFCDIFLENITQLSDTLVLSCAPPYQGGHHHVNEQPKRYWREKLSRRGFAYNRKRTGTLSETFKADKPELMWMCQQISVYERVPGSGPAVGA